MKTYVGDFEGRRKAHTDGMATRRQIMDWLIYHVPLRDTGLKAYAFRIYFNSNFYIPYSDLTVNFLGETPWQCYKFATDQIFGDVELRKKFLILYYNS